jgi:hypothetical protein
MGKRQNPKKDLDKGGTWRQLGIASRKYGIDLSDSEIGASRVNQLRDAIASCGQSLGIEKTANMIDVYFNEMRDKERDARAEMFLFGDINEETIQAQDVVAFYRDQIINTDKIPEHLRIGLKANAIEEMRRYIFRLNVINVYHNSQEIVGSITSTCHYKRWMPQKSLYSEDFREEVIRGLEQIDKEMRQLGL